MLAREDRALILVLYTTKYRLGGAEMERAARLMARQRGGEAVRVESKVEFLAALAEGPIDELHFIGHSGLYGPMFGTTAFAEQMSRAEWAALDIPFAPGARAFFHCCRSARWFAPYFARRYGVEAHGHRSYTTFSATPSVYRPVREEGETYVVSVPGLKGMGLRGAFQKRTGRCPVIPMTQFEPTPDEDRGYDEVADLYDAVFEDFRVREDEWRWISARVPEGAKVLDLGCGNGSMLGALAPLIEGGMGVDASEPMLERARHRNRFESNLEFRRLDGPTLPVPDASIDTVTCILAWRYLDWDPMVAEIRRVLKPGGRLLLVDMVVSPFQLAAVPRVAGDKARAALAGLRKLRFRRALRDLVDDVRWRQMLVHHPMRAQHEYRNYLPSRFPGGRVEVLNRAVRAEILAFEWTSPLLSGKGEAGS